MKAPGPRTWIAIAVVTLVACGSAKQTPTAPTPPTPTAPQHLPPGVTAAMWSVGRDIFETGSCHVCHGPGGKNGPYGPDLADDVFLHNTGKYEDIIAIIVTGVFWTDFKSPKSVDSFFMLPLGGMSGLTDAELRSVAAYVWALSHPNG